VNGRRVQTTTKVTFVEGQLGSAHVSTSGEADSDQDLFSESMSGMPEDPASLSPCSGFTPAPSTCSGPDPSGAPEATCPDPS
jgi:hypothetical protein